MKGQHEDCRRCYDLVLKAANLARSCAVHHNFGTATQCTLMFSILDVVDAILFKMTAFSRTKIRSMATKRMCLRSLGCAAS